MSIIIDPDKEGTITRKGCPICLDLTPHKYIETSVTVIPDFRPYSGRRYQAPREAREISEEWECEKCGRVGTFNEHMDYPERRRRSQLEG